MPEKMKIKKEYKNIAVQKCPSGYAEECYLT